MQQGSSILTKDLIYKPVTDTIGLRQWKLKDRKMAEALAKKNLSLPTYLTEELLNHLKQQGKAMSGCEFLVIEATKM